MQARALVKSLSLPSVVLTLILHDSVSAKTDLANLSFHPVPLHHAVLETGAVASGPPSRQSVLAPPDVAAPNAGPDNSSATPASSAVSIAGYENSIANLQRAEGPYAFAIGEQAFALGKALQQQGDQANALRSFERSMHVLRVNLGLYSLEQVPVMKAMINSYVERGEIDSAHAMQEALFNLQKRHYGSEQVALVRALIEWADWNVNLYLLGGGRYVAGFGAPGQLTMQVSDPRLSLAYSNYASALTILHERADLGDARLVRTERKLAALNFMVNRELQDVYGSVASYPSQNGQFNSPEQVIERAHYANFADGSSALRRAIAYSYNAPEPDYNYIAARMMELGDWYLLFDRRSAALDIYADAFMVMQEASLPEEEVERIMTPGMPVPTPDTAYRADDERRDYAGFIDVEFDLSRFGMAQNPQIIGSSNADQQIEKELLREIRTCKFRPKFVAGSVVNDEKVQLRYYYSL